MAKHLDPASVGERTRAVHAGETPDPHSGASSPNLVMSSTFVTDSPVGFSAHEMTDETPYVYTRWANPTTKQLEDKISALEGAEATACFASGMAAAAAVLFTELSAGDRFVVSEFSYPGIAELARDTLPRFGVEVVPADLSDPAAAEAAIAPGTKLVFVDTPCNPILRLTDIRAVADIAHAAGARVLVDNTFATPMATTPLALGADYVMHSLTKYIGGHGDALGGSVSGASAPIRALVAEAAIHHGGSISPFNAWLIARGAATLPLRMRAHAETAAAVAAFLDDHPMVERVLYPGLHDHPQRDLVARQMRSPGAMIAFRLSGGLEANTRAAERLAQRLKIIHYAVSLGHHRTLICWMPSEAMLDSSFRVDDAGRARYREWAGDGIFRLSVGLEDAADLTADLEQALDG
jgi:cystathionine beta-lyase/cystathionine gamma-synthase